MADIADILFLLLLQCLQLLNRLLQLLLLGMHRRNILPNGRAHIINALAQLSQFILTFDRGFGNIVPFLNGGC
ncbi:hypothetical protein D3C74_439800 [compost metagenome]